MTTRRRRRSLGVFCLIWLIAQSSITSCRAGEPPLMYSVYEGTVRVKLMDDVKITCPVQADSESELMFNWIKDNESISAAWIRFRQSGPHLKIDNVEIQDGGTYTCRAVNGYGNQEVNIQLMVVESNDTTRHQQTKSTSDGHDDSNGYVFDGEVVGDDSGGGGDGEAPPDEVEGEEESEEEEEFDNQGFNFTQDTLLQPTLLRVTTRSSFSIQCGAIGHDPYLIWFKNGKEYPGQRPTQLDENGWTISRYPLFIRKATMDKSGNYTCLARRSIPRQDQIEITFIIQVFDIQKTMSNLTTIHPTSNTTELRGGKVRFNCWVTSGTKPQVEWLKMLPPGPHKGQIHTNTSLIYGDDQYQTLTSEGLSKNYEDGTYLKSLILYPLRESQAGTYICFASNENGYNLEKTHLTVKPNYETKENKSVPLSIMVALPSALILSIAGGFVCWVREREKQRRREVAAAAAAAAGGGIVGGYNRAALEASVSRLSTGSFTTRQQALMSGGISGGGSVAGSRRQSCNGNNEPAEPTTISNSKSTSTSTSTERGGNKQQRGGSTTATTSRPSVDNRQQQQQQQSPPNHYFERRHNQPRVSNTSSSLV